MLLLFYCSHSEKDIRARRGAHKTCARICGEMGKMVVITLGLGLGRRLHPSVFRWATTATKFVSTEEEKTPCAQVPLVRPCCVINVHRTPHAGLRIMNARVYTKSRIY